MQSSLKTSNTLNITAKKQPYLLHSATCSHKRCMKAGIYSTLIIISIIIDILTLMALQNLSLTNLNSRTKQYFLDEIKFILY